MRDLQPGSIQYWPEAGRMRFSAQGGFWFGFTFALGFAFAQLLVAGLILVGMWLGGLAWVEAALGTQR